MPGNQTSPACLLLFVSGLARQIARTRSGASCLGVVPARTSAAVLEMPPENDLRPPVAEIRVHCRPHNGRQSPPLAHTSCARHPPTGRTRNADKYSPTEVKLLNPAAYPSPCSTCGLPPDRKSTRLNSSHANI